MAFRGTRVKCSHLSQDFWFNSFSSLLLIHIRHVPYRELGACLKISTVQGSVLLRERAQLLSVVHLYLLS